VAKEEDRDGLMQGTVLVVPPGENESLYTAQVGGIVRAA